MWSAIAAIATLLTALLVVIFGMLKHGGGYGGDQSVVTGTVTSIVTGTVTVSVVGTLPPATVTITVATVPLGGK